MARTRSAAYAALVAVAVAGASAVVAGTLTAAVVASLVVSLAEPQAKVMVLFRQHTTATLALIGLVVGAAAGLIMLVTVQRLAREGSLRAPSGRADGLGQEDQTPRLRRVAPARSHRPRRLGESRTVLGSEHVA